MHFASLAILSAVIPAVLAMPVRVQEDLAARDHSLHHSLEARDICEYTIRQGVIPTF